jgi:hypothetical protein
MELPASKRQRVDIADADRHGFAFMLTDVEEENNGNILLWGITQDRKTVLACVPDYQPYFLMPCPYKTSQSNPQAISEPTENDLQQLKRLWNGRYVCVCSAVLPHVAAA